MRVRGFGFALNIFVGGRIACKKVIVLLWISESKNLTFRLDSIISELVAKNA